MRLQNELERNARTENFIEISKPMLTEYKNGGRAYGGGRAFYVQRDYPLIIN